MRELLDTIPIQTEIPDKMKDKRVPKPQDLTDAQIQEMVSSMPLETEPEEFEILKKKCTP